ncbi:hypothetical protein O3P69_013954 [Scylla paramamosain]|uniref:Uncharacterized protein n=1 Tax=Scylla paramamosain TaxID=85552 RepID=A0AAW0SQP0_SCYPA
MKLAPGNSLPLLRPNTTRPGVCVPSLVSSHESRSRALKHDNTASAGSLATCCPNQTVITGTDAALHSRLDDDYRRGDKEEEQQNPVTGVDCLREGSTASTTSTTATTSSRRGMGLKV